MKRNNMRKGVNSKSLGSRQGLKIKSGQFLMTKNAEIDTIKTQAIDRLHSRNASGMNSGTTPLKARPKRT